MEQHIKNIIYCLSQTYKYFQDYIQSITNKLNNCNVIIYSENTSFLIDKKCNHLFVQKLPEIIIKNYKNYENYENIYVINTEQLCRKYDSWREEINAYPDFVKFIDFSLENIKYYKKHTCYYIPYQINYDEIYNFEKSKDICIITDNNMPEYRKKIINEIVSKGYKVDVCSGWSKDRDITLMKYKILINISYSQCAKIMEQIRCNRCVFNKMIVISDNKLDTDYILKDYVIFEDYSKLADKVIEVYNNYNIYYDKLFSKLDLNYIDKIQLTYLNFLE